jgi:uncharacterized protein (TIGR03083 family)
MQLAPRYGADPVLTIAGPPAAIAAPAIRQRTRLAEALATLDAEQWDHPSRCEGWSSRDVIVHLESTNGFWAYSISSGLKGEPTELLATFDPVASPAELVDASSEVSTGELLDRFVASSTALTDLLGSLDGDDWTAPAEAPPGHISVSAVAHHALWDSRVHERDVLLPLGLVPDEEPDEVAASLRYVAALAPASAVNLGHDRAGTLAIETTAPELAFTVEVGDSVAVRPGAGTADFALSGDAVELVEGLSFRAPLPPETSESLSDLLGGLGEAFDLETG